MPDRVDELPSPGWQAIDDAMARLYGAMEPRHVGYQPPAAFSTNLQGCSAYASTDHWHYVSYGLSELYVRGVEDDPEYSGWGFELTMRVLRSPGEQAPGWPFAMVNEMAKHVNGNSVLLEVGDRIDLRQPVTGYPHVPDAPPTELTVFAVTLDPQLGEISTENGRVAFLQLVGVTESEKDQMVETNTAEVLAELARINPFLVTDPRRSS